MSGMDERKRAHENKFAHDEEAKFKAEARRNRKLGAWAANKLGLSGSEAEAYANEVVKADFQEAGDEDVLRKVSGDFAARNVAIDDAAIRQEMDRLLVEAADEIEASS